MFRKMFVILATVCASVSSHAAVVVFFDESAYLAAVGSTRTYIDFAGSPAVAVSGGSFAPNVTFGSCTDSTPGTCGTTVLHNNNAITDLGGSAAPNGVASLAWRFNQSDIFAFGLHYTGGEIDAVTLVATDLSLDVLDTSAATGFIGLLSDGAFYGGIGVNAVQIGGGNDRYFIDDFRINERAAQVDEPASLALVGLALLGMLGIRNRRR